MKLASGAATTQAQSVGASVQANADAVASLQGTVTDQQRKWWSFQPLQPVDAPKVTDKRYAHWAKTPIDNFILANLVKSGLTPAPQADRRALIRRATYDLTGLPPTEEEVEAFEHDRSANAWEKVIDRFEDVLSARLATARLRILGGIVLEPFDEPPRDKVGHP